MIYFAFLILFGVTTVLEIDHQMPESAKFLHGGVYQGFAAVGDAAGAIFLVGICWALVRRYVQRPYRIRIKTKPEDAVILTTFLVIGLTGFLTEGIRLAEAGTPSFERWSLVGYPIGELFDSFGWSNGTLADLHTTMWIVHFAAFVAFLVILPITKLRHMVTSPMNMYLSDKDRPKGAIARTPDGGKTFSTVAEYSTVSLPRPQGDRLYWLVEGALLRGTNKGAKWEKVSDVKGARYGPVFGKDAKQLFVLTSAGVVESTDGGSSWSKPIAVPKGVKGVSSARTT